MSVPTAPSPSHRHSATDADRPRRLPGLATQAALVAAGPALLVAATHPALVATAVASAALTAAAMTLARRRQVPRPVPAAE